MRCCERLAGLPYRLFLDSAARGTRLGRYSFLTADPVAVVRSKGGAHRVPRSRRPAPRARRRRRRARRRSRSCSRRTRPTRCPGCRRFRAARPGYLGLRLGARRSSGCRRRATTTSRCRRGARHLRLGARLGPRSVAGMADLDRAAGDRRRRARAARRRARGRRRGAAARPRGPSRPSASPSADAGMPLPRRPQPRALLSRRGRLVGSAARRCARRSRTPATSTRSRACASTSSPATSSRPTCRSASRRRSREPPWALYRRLRARNPAPFAAFLDFPGRVGRSARRPSASCASTPAGTSRRGRSRARAPRGVGPEHDAALGQALTESAKDRAENLMIVDLMRNDLSRVCAPGTRARARAVRARALRHRAPPGLDRRRRARAGRRRARPAARRVSRRLDHRRAEGARDGDHRRARAVASAASTAARSATGA